MLNGKTAFVTGGLSGIGLAVARLFAAEGAAVIFAGRDPERLLRAQGELGAGSWSIAVLAHASGTRRLTDTLETRGVLLDVLVANAGASNAAALFDTTEADFDATVDANFKSAFFTVLDCFGHLKDGASVILTSSVGYQRGTLGDPLYAAAKAGVRTLGRGFAAQPEFLSCSIRVNVVSHGAVSTAIRRRRSGHG